RSDRDWSSDVCSSDLFEVFARDTLRSDLAESPLVDVAEIHPHALLFNGEQIDCVMRIGKHVLLLELKCFLLPITPIDELNYAQKIGRASCRDRLWASV